MSGQDTLRTKLSAGYSKLARKLGKTFNVYRPTTIQNVLDQSNFIGEVDASLTISKSFSNEQSESFKHYICYCDMDAVEVGDVLNDGVETFVVIWNNGIDDVLAIKADYLVDIERPTWSTDGGFSQKPEKFARNVPASFASVSSVSNISIPSIAADGQAVAWEVRIWTCAEAIAPDDIIVRASDGLRLKTMTIQNNKQNQILTCRAIQRHGQS